MVANKVEKMKKELKKLLLTNIQVQKSLPDDRENEQVNPAMQNKSFCLENESRTVF